MNPDLLSIDASAIERATKRFEHVHAAEEAPTLSVVVICFNHASFIEACLESIHAQEVPFRIEVIVGDDGSTDDSFERCLAFSQKGQIETRIYEWSRQAKWMRHGRRTGKLNFLRCYALARAPYVAVLDGDDLWIRPDKLRLQWDLMQRTGAVIVAANSVEGPDVEHAQPRPNPFPAGEFTKEHFRERNWTGDTTNTLLLHDVDKDETVRMLLSEFLSVPYLDWPLQLVLLSRGGMGIRMEECFGFYRQQPQGWFSSKLTIDRALDAYLVRSILGYFFQDEEAGPSAIEAKDRVRMAFFEEIEQGRTETVELLSRKQAWKLIRALCSHIWRASTQRKRPESRSK